MRQRGSLPRRGGQRLTTTDEGTRANARPRTVGGASLATIVEVVAVAAAALIAAVPAILTIPRLNYDSGSYLAPLSLSAERLPLVPAVFAVLGHNLRAIVVVQAVFGAACWSILAVEALRVARRPACYLAFIGVLATSCSDYVTHWYGAILSDSLSLSLTALLLASLASWLAGRGSLARMMAVAVLWALTRDTNGYLLLLFGLGGLAIVGLKARSTAGIIAAGAAILGGAAVIVSTDLGMLWVQPFLHVTTERVLVSAPRTAWFAAHGMPVTPTLLHQAGSYTPAADNSLRHSPALAPFRIWMHRAGERTYLEYALLHPWWALKGTFGAHQELARSGLDYYGGTASRPWLPGFVKGLFLSHRQTTLAVGAGVAAALLVVRRRHLAGECGHILWWSVLAVGGLLNLVIDWVGDSWEVGRHSVGATVELAVCVLFLAAIAAGNGAGGAHRPAEQAAC